MNDVQDRWRKLQSWENEMEERRLRGVHKWDYPHPINLWESWPWWVRWPVGAAIAIGFFGGVAAFLVGMSRLH